MNDVDKLRSLYTKRDEINSRIHEIEQEDNNYIFNPFHYRYDEKYGKEWNKLHHMQSTIYYNISLLEHKLGIGVFMTDRGLQIVTLKEKENCSDDK